MEFLPQQPRGIVWHATQPLLHRLVVFFIGGLGVSRLSFLRFLGLAVAVLVCAGVLRLLFLLGPLATAL